MKILFATIAEKGHFHSMIGVAQSLERAGHEVAFYAPFDISAPLARANLTRVFAGAAALPIGHNRGETLAAITSDPVRLREWIRALLLHTVPEEVARLGAVVRQFSPRVLVADPMAYAAPIVAHGARVPWVALSSSLNPVLPDALESELLTTVDALAQERDELFARYDLRANFRGCDCLSPHLTLALTTPALVGPPPVGVTLVGACLPTRARGDEVDFPWAKLSRAPLVYCSLGSQNFHHPNVFARVIDAVRERPVQLVIAAGDLAQLPSLPDNVLAVAYAPQLALLERARVMITHAGANSVLEAMHAGVPLLMSPLCNDQPHNAHFVTRAGAGLARDLRSATPADIWRDLTRLFAEPTHRERARRIADSFRELGGAEVAAARIEALA